MGQVGPLAVHLLDLVRCLFLLQSAVDAHGVVKAALDDGQLDCCATVKTSGDALIVGLGGKHWLRN